MSMVRQTCPMASHQFTIAAQEGPGGRIALRLPFDPKEAFGKARAPVRVTINEHPPFPTTVMVYAGVPWIGLRKGQIAEMGLAADEPVQVRVELDDAPREVDVPAELAAALQADPEASAAFDRLSFTHRKEYARWVSEAKREPTRQDRVAKTIERLKAGVTPTF